MALLELHSVQIYVQFEHFHSASLSETKTTKFPCRIQFLLVLPTSIGAQHWTCFWNAFRCVLRKAIQIWKYDNSIHSRDDTVHLRLQELRT